MQAVKVLIKILHTLLFPFAAPPTFTLLAKQLAMMNIVL